jgi:hypothetical protein
MGPGLGDIEMSGLVVKGVKSAAVGVGTYLVTMYFFKTPKKDARRFGIVAGIISMVIM